MPWLNRIVLAGAECRKGGGYVNRWVPDLRGAMSREALSFLRSDRARWNFRERLKLLVF